MTTATDNTQVRKPGAGELARALAAGEFTCLENTDTYLARVAAIQPKIRPMTVVLGDEARQAAARADETLDACRAAGTSPPPLCGVPISVKDCFDVAGTAATLGIEGRAERIATQDCPLVRRLREAGAVILGKTNVPQMMLLHCCDNPLYGRTLHPDDPLRGPGGSSGGEAAIVAASGSAAGLASDLGGSIRQPAHACGLVGFKPTSGRLTNVGSHRGLPGMDAIKIDSGPIVRRVEDAALMMRALVDHHGAPPEHDESSRPWRDYRAVDVSQLTLATAVTDHYFEASPPCQRAVREAHLALEDAGAHTVRVSLNGIDRAMKTYFGLVSADGFRSVRRMLKGSRVDWQIRRQSWFVGLPKVLRATLAIGLRLAGQKWLSRMLASVGARSADSYWRLHTEAHRYRHHFWQQLDAQVGRRVDALICPPHALPALRHGTALDLLPAGSYCYLANLLGAPAGSVPWTTVHQEEQQYPVGRRSDLVIHLARKTMEGSAGLPIGVQVIARPWDDEIVLAVMEALERPPGA